MNSVHPDPSLAYWQDFPQRYRQEQIADVAAWANSGESGVLVGGSGMGKSNLLGFLATRPDALRIHAPAHAPPVHLIRFDSNSLPAFGVAYFYRGLLYALREGAGQFGAETYAAIDAIIQAQTHWEDPFLVHAALQQAHDAIFQRVEGRLLWLLDRFDEACQRLDVQALNTLRNLRDRFKGRLCYVMATRQPLARLRNPADFDELYELFAGRTCWIGCMVERDVQWVAKQMAERLHTHFSQPQIERLHAVTGGLPAFLKEGTIALNAGLWDASQPLETCVQRLLARPEFQRICREIWRELTPDEQQILRAVARNDAAGQAVDATIDQAVDRPADQAVDPAVAGAYLIPSGLLRPDESGGGWRIFSPIMAGYIASSDVMSSDVMSGDIASGQHKAGSRDVVAQTAQPLPLQPAGKTTALPPVNRAAGLMLHPKTRAVLRNGVPLDIELTPQEERLLDYFLHHEDEVCTKDELMQAVWVEEAFVAGIRDDRLAQLVKRLRGKIEPKKSSPTHILTVRGRGYRFVNR